MIVRKAYGAGLYAMSGPAFEPEATIALPTAKIAVMGPEAAVNAVFANKIAAIDDPDERGGVRGRATSRSMRRTSTSCGWRPSSSIDAVVDFPELRPQIVRAWPRPEARTGPSATVATACRRSDSMPFCEDCAKFWSPNSMPPTGKCPKCGLQIARPQEIVEAAEYRAPWHFKLMIVLAARVPRLAARAVDPMVVLKLSRHPTTPRASDHRAASREPLTGCSAVW